jgi:hypothetical protein
MHFHPHIPALVYEVIQPLHYDEFTLDTKWPDYSVRELILVVPDFVKPESRCRLSMAHN